MLLGGVERGWNGVEKQQRNPRERNPRRTPETQQRDADQLVPPQHVALTRALLSFRLWPHWPSFKLMAKIFIQHRSVECLCVHAPCRCVGLQKRTTFRLP